MVSVRLVSARMAGVLLADGAAVSSEGPVPGPDFTERLSELPHPLAAIIKAKDSMEMAFSWKQVFLRVAHGHCH